MTKIQITQEDIDESKELHKTFCSSQSCPIATAVRRIYDVNDASSGYRNVWIKGEAKFIHTLNSQSFMLDFDMGKDIKPQEIELEEVEFVSHGIKKNIDTLAYAQKLWEENQPGG